MKKIISLFAAWLLLASPAFATDPWEKTVFARNVSLSQSTDIWTTLAAGGVPCLQSYSGSGEDLAPSGTCLTIGSNLAITSGALAVTLPTIGKAVVGTTIKESSFRTYKNATVGSGTAVFHLTTDGTSGGTALYSEVFTDSVQVIVSDAAASYQMSWAFSNSNKTLTVTANKLTTANILTGILGQAQANGAVVRLSIEGK